MLAESNDHLQIAVRPDGDRPTVVVVGEIDLGATEQLRSGVDEALAHGATSIDFDLTGVSFMDSTGLGVLALTSDRTSAIGGSVRVKGANKTILRLLQVSRLDSVIHVA